MMTITYYHNLRKEEKIIMYLDSTMILILIFVYNILIFRVCLIHIKNAKTELIKKQNCISLKKTYHEQR